MHKSEKKYARIYRNALQESGFADVDARVSAYEHRLHEMLGSEACVDLLHKWALIYAACALSKATGIPLLIVERETEGEVNRTLAQISNDVNMVMEKTFSRPIKNAPNGGTFLKNTMDTNGQLCWSAAVYIPVDL